MNKRQVIILWVIAIALGAAVLILKLNQKDTNESATKRSPGKTLFESFPSAEVAAIDIKGVSDLVSLTKNDGKWKVAQREDYPANPVFVNDLIRTLEDLKVTLGIEAGSSFAPRFGMDETATKAEDHGLTATFKDATGKEIAKVTLGKNIQSGAEAGPMGGSSSVGRYVRNHADTSGFYAVSEMFPSVSAEVPRWLADDFINPEKIKSISLSQIGKEELAWKITRETEDAVFKLEGAAPDETLNASVADPLGALFSYARFEDVLTADKLAEKADANAKRNAVIETFEGFIYNLTITPTKAATPQPETPAPASENQLVTVTVSAELPKERKKEEGEKPEDVKTKDAAFTDRLKTLTEKLTKEKALAGRTFIVGKTTVEALLKEREQLIAKATPSPAAGANQGSVQQLPGGFIATPPGAAPAKNPVEAVTPPISVPPADEKTK
ncbi:MAG: DUF4340 domain-containing protein [Gloeobacteraceae cyanobacterium ES-bin-144]|nr:DUF4340 domain-containing protein [Verrucomicrobiales bacterium]